MKSLREDLTLEGLNQGIKASSLPDHLEAMAKMRLELASEYIDDSVRLKDEIRPDRLVIVDLRDEFIEKDEALGLFVVLLQLFADAKYRDAQAAEHSFNKLVVFDDASSTRSTRARGSNTSRRRTPPSARSRPRRCRTCAPGEAFIWSSKASDEAFTKSAVKIRCRPRVTQHGGATKTAAG
jgi:DNA phosphorothioation-dependent restriction protein DptH